MNFDKHDKTGQVIQPGDVCVWKGELVLYKAPSWGGNNSRGEYGKFITSSEERSLKFTSVIFAFDPMGARKNQSATVKELCRKFYEG